MIFVNKSELKSNIVLEFQIVEEVDSNKIFDVNRIYFKKGNSIYVEEESFNIFYLKYSNLFSNVYHQDGNVGRLDMYGLNYISLKDSVILLSVLEEIVRKDNDVIELIDFVKKAINKNGFYILGI